MSGAWRELVPFRRTPLTEGTRVEARAEATPSGIRLAYRIKTETPFRLPARTAHPERKDELWRSTCYEAFLKVAGSEGYFEFNASPSGHWAWYAFDRYREGMMSPPLEDGSEPRRIGSESWFIPIDALAGMTIERIGLNVIIEYEGELSYWALAHPGPEADFHSPGSFVPFG